ncbi:MAG: chemotaxis protein CheW [Solirubrobacterales bacterium]
MDTSQYMSMFLEESMDNLQSLNESLLQLEQEPNDIDKLNEIFRIAHTIKGMAATMGFNRMAELTHKMEDVLSEFREGKLQVTQNVVTTLFKCLDTLENMVNNINEGADDNFDIDEILKELEVISEPSAAAPPAEAEAASEEINTTYNEIDLNQYELNIIRQAHIKDFKPYQLNIKISSNTLLKSARAFLIFQCLEENGEIIKSVPCTEDIESENFDTEIQVVYLTTKSAAEMQNLILGISEVDVCEVKELEIKKQADVPVEPVAPAQVEKAVTPKEIIKEAAKAPAKEPKPKDGPKKTHQSVRVDLERLDRFMNMVSELVINRTRLEQISTTYKLAELNETLEQVARTTSDLQDLVMKIRMLPLDTVFNRFPRMVRDLSVELGKEMELIIKGQDTELDRTVIDEIGEPLIHIIRNAADHGIESPEVRKASGKSHIGKIKLIAYQEGTKAVIKVEDDGKGLSVKRIKEKAEESGINTEGMSDADIRNLIFIQGFSTNKVVTDISGRGVGMDVVKTKISALGGTVDVISEEGKGSSFIIRLPLTLQIIQALLVRVGSETMAISLGYIDRVIDYKEELIKRTNNKEVIVYNGNVISLIRLNKVLNIEESDNSKKYIVIVKVGERTVGLLADTLLGQREIVIKPLGKTLQGLKQYIGATILGDGLVTLILDVAALI